MPARRILQLGDPMLREVSRPVESVSEVALVLRDLRATLHGFQRTHGFGRGISAIQIGEPVRVVYIEFEGRSISMVNPEFTDQSAATFTLWDDCFSFPNLMVQVERSCDVSVKYLNENGTPQGLTASGPLAELLQHELDHLDGILAVDRALDRNSFRTREEHLRRTGT